MLKEKQILKTSGIIWQAIENIHDEEKHQASDADACDICLNSYPIRIAVWAEAETRKNNKPKDGVGLSQHNLFRISGALGNKMMECHEAAYEMRKQKYNGIAAGYTADLFAYAEAKKKIDAALKATEKK